MEVNFPLRYHLLIKRKRRYLPCRSIRTRCGNICQAMCANCGSAVGLHRKKWPKSFVSRRGPTATWNVEILLSAPALMALLLILKEDEVAELLNDFRKITEKLDGKEVA